MSITDVFVSIHCLLFCYSLALIMQNEEFLRELKRNEDFMRTLEFERGKLLTCTVYDITLALYVRCIH